MDRTGWLPIRLHLQPDGGFVTWCWLGTERFTEPFFDATIDLAQRRPFNALFTHRTPIGELAAWHSQSPGLTPAGFIFHMSRSGSTLVTQMLAALADNVVISEARPLDCLARADWIPETQRAEWLRWMVSALAQRRAGTETRCFIKFDSPVLPALSLIRRTFPSVPWIFIYRNPEEVLASHLREPTAATTPGMIGGARLIDVSLDQALAMTHEEYAARVLGRICECALRGFDRRGLFVDYAELPDALWVGIARHFGFTLSGEHINLVRQAALFNAKRPRERFEADSEHKRRALPPLARAEAAKWIRPYFDELVRVRMYNAVHA